MKFGIFSLPTYFPETDGSLTEFYDRILQMMRASERLGFDMAWFNEHHFHPYGGMIPAPPVLMAAVAAQTERIRLGTSVALLPLHHPLEQAEAYAMVDQLSGGRLELGVGRGFLPYDYQTMGVDYATAQERLYESLEVVLKAWQQQPFSHAGRFYTFRDVAVWPVPLQKPHPPIWGAATRNDESFAWIGRHGYDLLTVIYLFPLERLARQIGIFRQAARESGRDPRSIRVSTHFQVYCSESREDAHRVGKAAIHRYAEQITEARLRGTSLANVFQEPAFEELLDEGRICIGTPDDCVAILEHARDELGLTQVDCQFFYGGIPWDKAFRSHELFATEVIPRLRSAPQEAMAAGA